MTSRRSLACSTINARNVLRVKLTMKSPHENRKTPPKNALYDAFASHATDPDSRLVRRVKADLEAFHLRPGVQDRYRSLTEQTFEAIRICVDGIDFVFPKSDPEEEEPIDALVQSYLARSTSLLVFSGTETKDHPWVNQEIDWFFALRPNGEVHFALTHAPDPANHDRFMPPALSDRPMGLFSDLRGFYRRRFANIVVRRSTRLRSLLASAPRWISVRDYEEELARLAVRLLSNRGDHAFAVEDLEKSFETALRVSRRRSRTVWGVFGAAFLAMAIGLLNTALNLTEEQGLRTNRIWTSRADLLRADLDASLMDSLALSVNAMANGDRLEGPRGLVETMQRLVPSEVIYRRIGDVHSGAAGARRAHIETLTELDPGKEALIGGIDGYLVLLDLVAGQEVAELYLDHTRILDIAVLPDERGIAVATQTGMFFVHLQGEGRDRSFELIARSQYAKRVFSVAYDPVWNRIVRGDIDGRVMAFPVPEAGDNWEGHLLYQFFDPDFADPGQKSEIPGSVSSFVLRVLPDGTVRGFFTSYSHFAGAIDLTETGASEVWPKFFDSNSALSSIDVNADGTVAVVTDLKGQILVLSGETGTLLAETFAYQSVSASLSQDLSGEYKIARPDVAGNVSLALHPSGQFFGVSSHDQTTKFFSTREQSAGGMAAAVHDRMARDIVFSADGLSGYTMSDDGVLQRIRPLEIYEDLRIRGVRSAYPIAGTDSVLLKPDTGGPWLWSAKDGFRPAPGAPEPPGNWTMLPGNPTRLISFGAQTHLFAVSAERVVSICEGKSIEQMLNLGQEEDIRIGYFLGPSGRIVFPSINIEESTKRLFEFDPSACNGNLLNPDAVPEDAKITVSAGVIAVETSPSILRFWVADEGTFKPHQISLPETVIESIAFGPAGTPSLSVQRALSNDARRLCLCSQPSDRTAGCSSAYAQACETVALPENWAYATAVETSSSGARFIVHGQRGAVGILQMPFSPWQSPRVIEVSPAKVRGRQAPFAFNIDETLLAVPGNDTDILILDLSDLSPLSLLPSPGRPVALAFHGDFLLSAEGSGEDKIVRLQSWRAEDLIARSCAYWHDGVTTRPPPGVPATQPRSAFCPY